MLNAAVWCGSSIFLVFALPAVFSPDLKRLLTDGGVGFAAEAIMSRFFILQYCCGGIALAHLLGEWLYSGRTMWRLNLWLISTVLVLGLLGGLVAQPRMRALHIAKYYGHTAAQQIQAAKAFAAWHGVSETANLVVICCLICYLWQVNKEPQPLQFVSFSKIRG